MCAGYFQPEQGQIGCINCDSLGDVYQEDRGATSCQECAKNTQRYILVLSAANRSSCQCKEGAWSSLRVLHCEDDKSSWDGAGCVLALWQVITIRRARLGRCVTPFIAEVDTHGLMLGLGRSAQNVRGAH